MKGNQRIVATGKYTDSKGRKIIQTTIVDKPSRCKDCGQNPRAEKSSRCAGCNRRIQMEQHDAGRLQLKIKKQQAEKVV